MIKIYLSMVVLFTNACINFTATKHAQIAKYMGPTVPCFCLLDSFRLIYEPLFLDRIDIYDVIVSMILSASNHDKNLSIDGRSVY